MFNRIRSWIRSKERRNLTLLELRYKKFPRYKEKKIKMDGMEWNVPDIASFIAMYRELICKQIYRFDSNNDSQIIVDFGANVGLSVYYFAKNYPNAEIYAYEADPNIYRYLEKNVRQFDNGHIHLFNLAVWNENAMLHFYLEGADGGHITNKDDGTSVRGRNVREILCEFSRIDLLKIDVEGAERVIVPCMGDELKKVEKIFLEYHSEADKTQCLVDILWYMKKYGFRMYLDNGFMPQYPLYKREEYFGFDLQLNIYGVKEKIDWRNV